MVLNHIFHSAVQFNRKIFFVKGGVERIGKNWEES